MRVLLVHGGRSSSYSEWPWVGRDGKRGEKILIFIHMDGHCSYGQPTANDCYKNWLHIGTQRSIMTIFLYIVAALKCLELFPDKQHCALLLLVAYSTSEMRTHLFVQNWSDV
jgi:hypothetical protein